MMEIHKLEMLLYLINEPTSSQFIKILFIANNTKWMPLKESAATSPPKNVTDMST